jgi:hypothetical protein
MALHASESAVNCAAGLVQTDFSYRRLSYLKQLIRLKKCIVKCLEHKRLLLFVTCHVACY